MIKIAESLWLGNSTDADSADLRTVKVSAILNVAHDLEVNRGWQNDLLYAKCGLVDGPGSTIAAYHSAVLQALSLLQGGRTTLIVDHECGGRAISVAIMVLHAHQSRRGWDYWLAIIKEKLDSSTDPHSIHKSAFDRINWRLITSVMEG